MLTPAGCLQAFYNKACILDDTDLRNKIKALYAGTLPPGEREVVLQQLETLSATELEAIYPFTEWEQNQNVRADAALAADALHRFHAARIPQKAAVVKWLPPRRWLQVACVVGLLLLGSYYLLRKTAATPVAWKEIRVADGKRSRLTLPDGSVLVMNGGSVLLLPAQFNGPRREVYLKEGQAFVEVVTDPAHPFIFHSAHFHVQVLGTSFTVRDYAGAYSSAVTVKTGKVAVQLAAKNNEKKMYLLPGEQAAWQRGSDTLLQEQTGIALADAWINGELQFKGEVLRNILPALQHRYAVYFTVNDNRLLDKKFSATFTNSSIEAILKQLQLMGNIRYTIKGQHINLW